MKKLLSMALAMVLLFASMGTFAAEETNLIFHADFEAENDEEVTMKSEGFSAAGNVSIVCPGVGEGKEAIPASPGGGNVVRIANTSTTTAESQTANRIEWYQQTGLAFNTLYKVSFWYYSTSTKGNNTVPWLSLTVSDTSKAGNITSVKLDSILGAFYTVPQAESKTWTYYEVYLMTHDARYDESGTLINDIKFDFRFLHNKSITEKQYYDDIKITKADSAFVGFTNAAPTSSNPNHASWGGRNTPQKSYTVDNKSAWIYPYAVAFNPLSVCSGTVKVLSRYIPRDLDETTMLIAGVYKDNENGLPQLQEIVTKTCEYKATPVTDAESGAVTHYIMGPGYNTMDIDTTPYGEGCYIECFMWSSISGMKPLSDGATLPAATSTVQ